MAFRLQGERAVADDLAAGGTASHCFRRLRRIELISPIGSPDGIHATASLTSPTIALGDLEVYADVTSFRDDGGDRTGCAVFQSTSAAIKRGRNENARSVAKDTRASRQACA